MGWSERNPYKYYPEWGPYYHEVWPHVYCGSQPRSQHDIDELAALLGSDGSILSLQQDRDLRHWGVDLLSLQTRASKHHLRYLRQPVSLTALKPLSMLIRKHLLPAVFLSYEDLALNESARCQCMGNESTCLPDARTPRGPYHLAISMCCSTFSGIPTLQIGPQGASQTRLRLLFCSAQAQDFDPHSLRSSLPGAVAALDGELRQGRSVYVHCTAGLGRAPAACIAYLYWFQDFQLQSVSTSTLFLSPVPTGLLLPGY